jgi:predicted regulator of Ras-like GTPase activity (Roadblock/LC7/MglB family)
MASKTEKLTDVLRSVRASSPEIIGASVVTSDGFIIASVLPSEVDEELIGGMAASLLGVGERISNDLMRAAMEQVYVRSPKGYIIVNAIGSEASLVVLVSKDAKLGLVFLELKRTTAELLKHV